ncbi:hypothetical protein CB599_11665 [Salmonella enterica subsp. enterica serovar Adjame]|nr:hypothetical protein [Salmonella enterica subsp. enterica serovar Adjame]
MKSTLTNLLKKKTDVNSDVEQQILTHCFQSKDKAEATRSLAIERFEHTHRYYFGELPKPAVEGTSKQVVQVLYKTVKAAIPQLFDTFTSDGENLSVKFTSKGFRKNAALEKIIEFNINESLRKANFQEILRDCFKGILVPGFAFLKVFPNVWSEKEKDKLDDWQELVSYMQTLNDGWSIEPHKGMLDGKTGKTRGFEWKTVKNVELNQQTGQPEEIDLIFIKGKIPLIKHHMDMDIDHCHIQDLWIDTSRGEKFEDAPYICHRIKMTVGEAKKRGFDPEKIDKAGLENIRSSAIDMGRVNYLDPMDLGQELDNETSVDPECREIDIFEHYIHSSFLNEDKEIKKYQVTTTDKELLKIQEIPRFPFVHGRGEKVHGLFFGRSFYDTSKMFQDTQSTMLRAVLDNAMNANFRRYVAVKGQYDRQSLLNNRPGAVIEQMATGMVDILPYHALPPGLTEAWGVIQDEANATLTQPSDASNANGNIPQVAAATVALKLYQDAQKGMALSKTIGDTLLKPFLNLYYEIFREEGFPLLDLDGKKLPPVELPDAYEFDISIKTTNDDLAQAMQLTSAAQFIMQASGTQSTVLTPQNQYNIAKALCDRFDLDNEQGQFFTDPSQNQDPHAAQEQAEQMFMDSEAKKIQLELLKTQLIGAAKQNALTDAKIESMRMETQGKLANRQADTAVKLQKIQGDHQNKQVENMIKAQEVGVKRDAVQYEAAAQARDITIPRVNGVR